MNWMLEHRTSIVAQGGPEFGNFAGSKSGAQDIIGRGQTSGSCGYGGRFGVLAYGSFSPRCRCFSDELVEPDSVTRLVCRTVPDGRADRSQDPASVDSAVLFLGDSTMGEGFSARIADGARARACDLSTARSPERVSRPGITPLREVDPQRNAFSVIVLPVHAPLWAVGATAGLLLFVTELFTTGETIPFVYFQF